MNVDIRPCASAEEVRQAISPIGYYFGRSAANEDQTKRFARVLPVERVYAAWEGSRAVGGLAALPLQLTVPGGRVRAAGVTLAGVLPTHRRRGLFRAMMRVLLDACRMASEPVLSIQWRASNMAQQSRLRYAGRMAVFHPSATPLPALVMAAMGHGLPAQSPAGKVRSGII